MAVIDVKERFEGRQGSIDEKGIRKFTRVFWVTTNDLADGPKAAAAVGVPALYDFYVTSEEYDYGCIAKNISSKDRADNPYIWEVTVEYDSAPLPSQAFPSSQNNNQQQPNLRPWTYSFSSNRSTKPITTDTTNVDVLNSAGLPFDPPLEAPVSNPILKITAYCTTFSYTYITTYQDAVNSDVWQGFAPGMVRCVDYAATSKFDNGEWYWQLDVSVEMKWDLWNPQLILDAGTVEIFDDSGTPKYRQITDSYGQPVTSPVPLDGAGHKLAAGGDPVYLSFYPYRAVPFANLIPTT